MNGDIIGAGLTGLIAAHAWPNARVMEREPERTEAHHNAVLRFRTEKVAALTGIPFRRVTVRKSIWARGRHYSVCTPQFANLYSRKTRDRIDDRSIWNLDPAERWVAPPDFYARMADRIGGRIWWDSEIAADEFEPESVITAPLSTMLPIVTNPPELVAMPIYSLQYRVPNCDAFQTVYCPDDEHHIYRASLTGDRLIVERTADVELEDWIIYDMLGIDLDHCELLRAQSQRFGKINPLPDGVRRALLYEITTRTRCFMLGRFATWRNVLLDDIVQDIAVINRLIESDEYTRLITSTGASQ